MIRENKMAVMYRAKGKLWHQLMTNVPVGTVHQIMTSLREKQANNRDEIDYMAIPMDFLPKPAPRSIRVDGANVKNWLTVRRVCQRRKR